MKEQDVRQRIGGFLKRTARELIIPASVGLSLGLSGCGSNVPPPIPAYGAAFSPDARAQNVPPPIPAYGAAFSPDARAQEVGVSGASMDAAVPDSGVDAVAPDAGVDAGMIDGETD
jgi:hypothetical protein